jgi:arginine/lysine/ornithine decarboxylase
VKNQLAQRNLDSKLYLASTGEPRSFAEAKRDKAWQATMREEIEAVEINNTWELVDPPHGH